MSRFSNPWPQFIGPNGQPYDSGRVYFGEPNEDPLSFPKVPYQDAGFTIPLGSTQILNDEGAFETPLFLNGTYSLSLFDKKGNFIRTEPQIQGVSDSEDAGAIRAVERTHFGSELVSNILTLVDITLQPGVEGSTDVLVNGVPQIEGEDFQVITGNTIQFTGVSPYPGDKIKVYSGSILSSLAGDAAIITYSPAGATSVPTNVQDKLRERVSVKDFGAVGDGVVDDSSAFQDAIDAVGFNGVIEVPFSPNPYIVGDLLIDEKPLTFKSDGQRAAIIQVATGASSVLTVNNCSRKNIGRAQFYQNGQAHGFTMQGITLEGNSRQVAASGLVFTGLNDDVLLQNVKVYQFNGVGIDLGDENSSTTGFQGVRESTFSNVEIKNCGTTSLPAYRIGRSATATEDNFNNIWHENFSVVYPYGEGIHIRNEAVTDMRNIYFNGTCFFHGTRNLPALDDNGVDPHSTEPMLVIGGGAGEVEVYINDCVAIDGEDGLPLYDVLDRARVQCKGGKVQSGSSRFGFRFTNAHTSQIMDINTNDQAAFENMIDIVSMAGNHQVTIGGWSFLHTGSLPAATITPTTDLNLIQDLDMFSAVYQHPADQAATDSTGGIPSLRVDKDCSVVRAQIIVNDAVTANDTNYATINYRVFSSAGSEKETVSVTTQTTGTGDITAKTGADIGLPSTVNRLRASDLVQMSIGKSGTGVIIPAAIIQVDLSPNIVR